MKINKKVDYIVGVDLGGTNVRAAVVDRNGGIHGESRFPSFGMDGLEITIGQILKAINGAIADSGVKIEDIAGIGMGVPGTHKSAEGIVLWTPNFKEDWRGAQLLAPIIEQTGLSACMGNDANVAAFGEYVYGAGKGAKIMVMITLGTGVGSGLIINGQIYTGVSESAPELGHHIIVADGPRCSCGRSGCLEGIVQRDAICARAAKKASRGKYTSLVEKAGGDLLNLTPAMISLAASEGDEIAIETLQETGYYIGIGIANAINILNPDKVIIGGGISQAGELLFDPIRRTVATNAISVPYQACQILPAELGDNAGILGGAALVVQKEGS